MCVCVCQRSWDIEGREGRGVRSQKSLRTAVLDKGISCKNSSSNPNSVVENIRVQRDVHWWFVFDWLQISTGCMSGCKCPDGQVLDSHGNCINPSDCPCSHNGQLYYPGETLTVDCNTWSVLHCMYSQRQL